MTFRCTKVRDVVGAFTAIDGKASPSRAWDVHLRAVVDSGEAGQVSEVTLLIWGAAGHDCAYKQGAEYELAL